MKARVKGTNNIIDVEFNKDAFNEGYPPYWEKENNMFYQPEQLEWVDNEENAEPDYWTRLEHQAAISIYCAYIERHNWVWSYEDIIFKAHTLVEKLKEK